MGENILIAIVGVLVLGVLAQWISWRFKIPSILLLRLFGFLVGPVGGIVNPDEVLGNLLFPVVFLSVAIILFEGGLSLKYLSTPDSRKVTVRLVTLGLAATWIVAAAAAYFILGLEVRIAVLLGAVLPVSGPTVIMPLLRSVRPKGAIGDLLKWEGMSTSMATESLIGVLVLLKKVRTPSHICILRFIEKRAYLNMDCRR